MQIFPFSLEASATSALNGVSAATNNAVTGVVAEANGFLNELNNQLAASGVTAVLAESGAPAGFRSISLDKDSLKSEDLEVLHASLKKRGFTDEQLNSIETMINSGQPMTLGMLMNSLTGKKRMSAALTEDERAHLGSALRKMGFTQDESTELESLMDQGKGGKAMQAINRKLRDMDKEGRISLDKAETQSLARGLDLSNKTSQKMLAVLGQNDEASLNKDALSALLAHAEKELTEKNQAVRKMAKDLNGAIDDTLKSAKFREATAADADARTSRKAGRSEERINDKLTAKSNGLGPEALAERIRRMAQETQEDDTAEHDQQQDRKEAQKAFMARRDGSDSAAGTRGEDGRARRAAASTEIAGVAAEGIFSPMTNNASEAAGKPEGLGASVKQELFSQVEKSMLRELSDGSRQLTLNLDPENMGKLTVLLTVRQGEVRAVIRTDNEETTSALSQQMAELKTSLEEQGLKVTQLEVETRMSDNAANQHWDSASQYNQEQELRDQARFLQLAKLRQEAGSDLARNMQNTLVSGARQEEISGLHIIT